MRKNAIKFIVVSIALALSITHCLASTIDADVLLDAMVNQGLISQDEAQRILDKSSQKKSMEESIDDVKAKDNQLPQWVKNITLHGELSVRYEQQKTKSTATPVERFRGRLRYRLGVESKLNEKVVVAAGFTSGDADPRSGFQSFSNSSEKADIRLDYAYGKWSAGPWFNTAIGKYIREDYLWEPTDMVWDKDIRPYGGAMHIETPTGNIKGFFNSGVMVLDELVARQDDPTMYFFQPGISFDSPGVDAKIAVVRYVFNSTQGVRLDHSACSNKGLTPIGDSCVGSLTMEYDAGGAMGELGYKFNVNNAPLRIAAFGHYIKNLATTQNEVGWAGGGRLGTLEVAKLGDWQTGFQYTYLQRDAILDIFPDSNRYDGQTNITGIKGSLDFGLWKNITMGINYYHDERIIGTKVPRTSLLTDITYKF